MQDKGDCVNWKSMICVHYFSVVMPNLQSILNQLWEQRFVIIIRKLLGSYFQHISGIHTPVRSSNILTHDFFHNVANTMYNVLWFID